MTDPSPARRRGGPGWAALAAAVGIPMAVYLGVVAAGYDGRPYLRGDCPYYYLTAASLVADGDLDLGNQLPGDPLRHAWNVALDRRGRLVPKHPILLPLASAPWVGLFGPPGALAWNLVQLGLLLAVLYALARRVAPPAAAAAAVAATGAASVLPHYAWNYSPDVFATLLLVAAVAALPPREAGEVGGRTWRSAAAGLLLGLAVAAKLPLLLTAPFFALLLPRPFVRHGVRFAAGFAVPLLLLAGLNAHLFGSPATTSYDRIAVAAEGRLAPFSVRGEFGEPVVPGLWKQLADRRHGLLPTSVLTVLSLGALPWLARRRGRLAAFVIGGSGALLLLFSAYRYWDHSHYGNRFLLPVVALAALPLAAGLSAAGERLRRWRVSWREKRPARVDLALALLLAVQLIPMWTTAYLPTQDGPIHLGNAALLVDLHRADRAVLRDYYEINPHPDPTWASHLALALLVSVFPPLVAEKLFLSAFVVALPLAFRFALGAVRPEARALAFLALPFSTGYFFHLGFHSFCWSLAALCLLLGYWLRRRGELRTWRERLAFAGLGLLVWLGHPVTLAVATAAVGVGGLWLARRGGEESPGEERLPSPEASGGAFAQEALGSGAPGSISGFARRAPRWAKPGPGDGFARQALLRAGVPLAMLSPALLGTGLFASRQQGRMGWVPFAERWRALWTFDGLVSYQRGEIWLSAGLGLVFLGLALWLLSRKLRRRSGPLSTRRGERVGVRGGPASDERAWTAADALLLAAGACLALFALAPNTMAGGGWITYRLNLLFFLLVALWLGTQVWPRGLRLVLQAAPAAVAVGLLALHAAKYAELEPYLEEYLAAARQAEPGSALLPMASSPWGQAPDGRLLSVKVRPFVNLAGYAAAETESAFVILNNYQAGTGYFPLRYRRERDPFRHLFPPADAEGGRQRLDLLSYSERTLGRVDHVLLWGDPGEAQRQPSNRDLFGQLEGAYELAGVSRPRGLGRLYRLQREPGAEP